MAFTYDLTLTGASLRISQVRLLVPDNDSTAYDLQDAEITYFLTDVGDSVKGAAVKACKWLARKYAKKATFSADGLSVSYGARADAYFRTAAALEAELLGGMTAVDLTRVDGYSENAGTSEYERQMQIIYINT